MAIHTITAEQSIKNYEEYLDGRKDTTGYSIQINGEIEQPTALDALDMLEGQVSLQRKAEFVRKLLNGCSVAVYLYDELVAEFSVTSGFQWFAVTEFQRNPQALRFVISSVYGVFLKNSVPHLTDSQRAVKQRMEQTASKL